MNTSLYSTEIARQHTAELIATAERNRLAKTLRKAAVRRARQHGAASKASAI